MMRNNGLIVKAAKVMLVMIILAAFAGCRPQPAGLTKVVLSLDWVPNTNHTGFYVALDKGWYAEEGIALDIQVPSDPSAALKQVAAGNTEFGVSFEDELTIARSNDIPIVSIAAIIQHNTSAFAVLKSSGITRFKDFEGKTFASSGLPIEHPILGALMACDGGDINKVKFVDVGFDLLPALMGNRADIAWIFQGWDGVQAQLKGVDLVSLPLYGSCVPDYYTPVVIAGEKTLAQRSNLVQSFLKATARGYTYAAQHPDEAAAILLKYAPESDPALVKASQAWLSPRYIADASRWGEQKPQIWDAFSSWMADNGLLTKPIDPIKAYTNDYLPQ
jgi:ABC-type nitrate/sulfonate/bicarbonate transport system substrate-binding protein